MSSLYFVGTYSNHFEQNLAQNLNNLIFKLTVVLFCLFSPHVYNILKPSDHYVSHLDRVNQNLLPGPEVTTRILTLYKLRGTRFKTLVQLIAFTVLSVSQMAGICL